MGRKILTAPTSLAPEALPSVAWDEAGETRTARWQSERGSPPPKNVIATDDRITANDAYGLACQGVGMLWRSDFQNARQLLTALASRVDRKAAQSRAPASSEAITADTFNRVRQARSQRARTLGMLLIELDADYGIALRRAPDVKAACHHAYGPAAGPVVVSLRELLGVIGAHQWFLRGIEIPAAGGHIHPHYGVFTPTRTDYVDLVAKAPWPAGAGRLGLAFDVGTGTGVLAAVLARRGALRVVATDTDPRAIACATENINRLGLSQRVQVAQTAFFPEGRADLVICNPPWVPARPGSPLERGIYDENGGMLQGFLSGLAAHLTPEGEGWLILSDLAERLGLRTREALLAQINAAGLTVAARHDVRPQHPRSFDAGDPLHAARRAEVTSLWRLKAASS
ncbi:MAG: methyltransferase domain-containing protein [Betaproteobacteria bacterium]|nr:methyltransferase domain-containing protein [Betaproteobacteria bacterium]